LTKIQDLFHDTDRNGKAVNIVTYGRALDHRIIAKKDEKEVISIFFFTDIFVITTEDDEKLRVIGIYPYNEIVAQEQEPPVEFNLEVIPKTSKSFTLTFKVEDEKKSG